MLGVRTHVCTHPTPCAALSVFVHRRNSQHCGTALIVIPSSVSLCGFVLILSTVQPRLLLASAVSKHGHGTASLPRFEMNAEHQTWFNKSVLLRRGPAHFQFTQHRGTQVQKLPTQPLFTALFTWKKDHLFFYKKKTWCGSWDGSSGHKLKAELGLQLLCFRSICTRSNCVSHLRPFYLPSCFAAFGVVLNCGETCSRLYVWLHCPRQEPELLRVAGEEGILKATSLFLNR